MLVQPARREYRTWIFDSRRWQHYRPRPTDIVIATYPKCGTTWMQRIVGPLIFGTPEPRPVMEISAWIDRRFPEPIDALVARMEAQEHRRFIKSHLPFDGLPIYDEVKYIHVARDGRDACMSFHNHASSSTPQMLDGLDLPAWRTTPSGALTLASSLIRRSGSTDGSWQGSCPATRTVCRACPSSTSSAPGETSSIGRTSCSSTTTTSSRISRARCGGSRTSCTLRFDRRSGRS